MVLTNLLALFTVAAAVPVFLHLDGAVGAAWATLLGESVLLAGYATVLSQADAALRPRALPAARVALAIAIGLATALVPGVGAVITTILGVALYAIAAVGLGAVPPGIYEQLPASLRRLVPRHRQDD